MKNCAIALRLRQPQNFPQIFSLVSSSRYILLEGKSQLVAAELFYLPSHFLSPLFLFSLNRLTIDFKEREREELEGYRDFGGEARTKANLSQIRMENSGQVIQFQRLETGHAYLFRFPPFCLRISRQRVFHPSIDLFFPLFAGFVLLLLLLLFSSSSSSRGGRGERWMTHDHPPRARWECALFSDNAL